MELHSLKNRQTTLLCLLLAAVTLAVYWPVRLNEFVNYDDPDYVTDNVIVQQGLNWPGVAWAFQTGHAANWHPLTWLSHMTDCQFYALKPWGHHLTSLLFHTANALLLFLLLKRMTGAQWRSALVAALFALHPLHVESVAWVSERKDVLSTFFGLFSLGAYVGYAQPKAQTANSSSKAAAGQPPGSPLTFHVSFPYLLSLLCFALSLMSKPMLVTLPFLMLLLDYWPLRRFGSSPAARDCLLPLLREKVPFFILTLVSCAVTFWVQRAAVVPLEHYPLAWRLLYAMMAYSGYLQHMIWPSGLSFLYLPHTWPVWRVAIAGLTLAGLTALALGLRRKFPYVAVGWFWYLGSLVPAIGLVQVGNQSMADRYTYIPLVGCFIILVWGGFALLTVRPVPRVGLAALSILTILGCIAATAAQLRYWRSSASLFGRAVACDRDNFIAQTLLGNALAGQGRFAAAESHYAEALRARPDYADAYVNRGFALAQEGKPDAALTNYLAALKLNPDHFGAHKNLGALLAERGHLDEAIVQFSEAVRLRPDDAGARYNLGTALLSRGRFAEAAAALAASLRLKPDDCETRENLALALTRQGKTAEALPLLVGVLNQRPDAQSHYRLAEALLVQGQAREAATHLKAALALQPDDVPALNNLAWILATHPSADVRDGPEAARLASRACELSGGTNRFFLATLAAAYAEAGDFADAVSTARRVRDLAAAAGDRQAVDTAQERITLYQSRKSYRQR